MLSNDAVSYHPEVSHDPVKARFLCHEVRLIGLGL